MRYSIFLTFIFTHVLCWSQVTIPPNDPTSHPSYAAFLEAGRSKNNNSRLSTAGELLETYPENSKTFGWVASALYGNNKPDDAVMFSQWAMAFDSYNPETGYYGFIHAVFANRPNEAKLFLENMQAVGQDQATMQRDKQALSGYVNSLANYPHLSGTVQKAKEMLSNYEEQSMIRAKATFESLGSSLGATYEGIAQNAIAEKILIDWVNAGKMVEEGKISSALYVDALAYMAQLSEKVNFSFGQKLEPHLEKIVFDQKNYSLPSRYRAFLRLARVQTALKRWDKVLSSSSFMIDQLKGKAPSTATLAKTYFYTVLALTGQQKHDEAAQIADGYVNLLPKLKSPEYIAEAYYVLIRAYAFNKDVEKGKAIRQKAQEFLKIPGMQDQPYVAFVTDGLSATENILGEGDVALTGNAYNDGVALVGLKKYTEAAHQFEKAKEEEIKILEGLSILAQRGYLDKFQRINGNLAASYYETRQFDKIYDVIESNRSYSLLNDKRSTFKQLPLKELQAVLGANEAYLSFIDVSKGTTYEGTYLMCLVRKNDVTIKYNRSAGAFADMLENDKELIALEKEMAKNEFRQPNLDYLNGKKTRKDGMFALGEFKLMTQYLRKHMEAKVVDGQYVFYQKEKMPDLLRRFYITFIDGLEDKLQGVTKLTISPEGLIGTIPFDALMDWQGRYLAERFEMGYIPSASLLYSLRKQPKKKFEKNVLAFGGATYALHSAPKAPLSSIGDLEKLRYRVREDLEKGLPLDYAFATFQSDEPMGFLEGGRHEVVLIKKKVPLTDTRLDEMMTENELKRMSRANELGKYRALHLSSHASVHPYVFDLSAFAMTVKPKPVDGEDGMLVVGEVEKLNLPIDFVMLSACQTALGIESPGDGIKGLNQALFNAGVSSTLTSLWSVSDSGTMFLSVELYDRMFNKSMATPTALAQVKRNFIAGVYGDQTHPYFWAPFIYTGY
ncbi:CHAT domain-containing protein [Flagellimonas sediminis]|uniref:CHAT domain-containing protein n=1 Tax=Flagellimonas sediminis TaxID=2696468 RepID=A0A6I5KP22_9FLAO|nr:CHAT domain-containing protein [Allomuricauda sediminis]NDV42446.1 CHAT domain-containing protein [Allomuricauda sediminis]